MSAVRAVCAYVRYMCRASEQAQRYRWKLNMLRNKAWRERVFAELGGARLLERWDNQPPPSQKPQRIKRRLFDWKIKQREHIRRCAKACAHPRILRDPCKLDQEGMFCLPPIRRAISRRLRHPQVVEHDYHYDPRPVYKLPYLSHPITVWPDEFRAFEEWEEEKVVEIEASKTDMSKIESPILFWVRQTHGRRASPFQAVQIAKPRRGSGRDPP